MELLYSMSRKDSFVNKTRQDGDHCESPSAASLFSPALVHERSRGFLLGHWASVVVDFGSWPGCVLGGVGARDRDAGVGAGFSGVAHDGGEGGVGRLLEVGLVSG